MHIQFSLKLLNNEDVHLDDHLIDASTVSSFYPVWELLGFDEWLYNRPFLSALLSFHIYAGGTNLSGSILISLRCTDLPRWYRFFPRCVSRWF